MESSHRKIELQSPADLTYLISNIRNLARQKLNLHLPTQPSDANNEPDELRKQVETLVDAFVAQVLLGMKQNISINGIDIVARDVAGGDAMDVDGALDDGVVEVEEFEPYDDKLRSRLAAGVQKRDSLVSKISAHRRTTAAAAARAFEEQFEREEAALNEAKATAEKLITHESERDVLDVQGLKRQAEVERNWERAVEGLTRLNQGLPETRARLERCGDVVDYLGGVKKQKL